MDPLSLSLLGAAIAPAAIQAARSIYKTIGRLRGEIKVEKRLGETFSTDVRNGISDMMRDPTILRNNPQAVLAAQMIIEQVLGDMDDQTRRSVEEGLHQQSDRSRIAYVTKILEESGPKNKVLAASNTNAT
jgi:hypothetical protein